MLNLYDPDVFHRLQDCVKASYNQLEAMRNNRDLVLSEIAHASQRETKQSNRKPINMLELAMTIYLSILAPGELKARVVPKRASLKQAADALSEAVSFVANELKIHKVVKEAIIDAMAAFGIIKVGVADSGFEIGARGIPGTNLYVSRIDPSDWVHDTSARTIDEAYFFGHAMTMYVDDLKNDPSINKEALAQVIKPEEEQQGDEYYDETEADKKLNQTANTLAKNPLEPQIRVWELYIPRHNLVVLVAMGADAPLKVVEWVGPEKGPYHLLRFMTLPNIPSPVPPMTSWIDIDDLVNKTYNKVAHRATAAKEVLVHPPGAKEDAQKFMDATDMDMIEADPSSISVVRAGEVDNNQLALAIHAFNVGSMIMGNLQLMGGMGAQSDTAQQDRLLAENANRRLATMQEEVISFTSDILGAVAWYIWHDPNVNIPITRHIESAGIDVEDVFDETSKIGNFTDYGVNVHPQSLRHQAPAMIAMQIEGILQRLIAPMLPILQQSGVALDVNRLMELLSDYYSIPELEQILTNIDTSALGAIQGRQVADVPASPTTVRKHIRINQGGGNGAALQSPQAILQAIGAGNEVGGE